MTKQYQITERQAEAIKLALEMGLYDVPRKAEYRDVAEELGVNAANVSELLRRGAKPVLEEEFVND